MEKYNMEKKQEAKKETLTNIDPRFFEQKAGYDQHTNLFKIS
jgi:hypothetical protein